MINKLHPLIFAWAGKGGAGSPLPAAAQLPAAQQSLVTDGVAAWLDGL